MSGAIRGVLVDAPFFPPLAKFPAASLDYTIAFPDAINPVVDFVAQASLACAPSGLGEMQISGLTVGNNTLTFTAAGGQPGRVHTLQFIVTMTDGRVFPFVGEMAITPVLTTDQAPTAPSLGFGATLIWNYAPTLNFSRQRNSINLL